MDGAPRRPPPSYFLQLLSVLGCFSGHTSARTQSIVLSHGFSPFSYLVLNMGLCSVDVALSTISSVINPLLRTRSSSLLPSASLSRFMLSVLGFFL
jgi:hypothetical protein